MFISFCGRRRLGGGITGRKEKRELGVRTKDKTDKSANMTGEIGIPCWMWLPGLSALPRESEGLYKNWLRIILGDLQYEEWIEVYKHWGCFMRMAFGVANSNPTREEVAINMV